MPATPRGLVEAALLAAAGTSSSRVAGARAIAVGWATVDLDRAVVELAAAFGLGPERFRPTARSIALGCVCRVASGVLLDGGSLALLEPDTEGRLAASLARLGEGPIVTWLLAPEPMTSVPALRSAGFALSAERSGPFGPDVSFWTARSTDRTGSWWARRRVPSQHDRSFLDLLSSGARNGRAGDRGALHGRGISGRPE